MKVDNGRLLLCSFRTSMVLCLLHEVVRVLTRTSHAGVEHYHFHGISCCDEDWLRSSTWKASWS